MGVGPPKGKEARWRRGFCRPGPVACCGARADCHTACLAVSLVLTVALPAWPTGAAVLGGKHLAEHIDERKVAYL